LVELVYKSAAQHITCALTIKESLREGIMGKITAILDTAQQRAKQMNLPYQGALLPAEAYQILQSAPGAKLVDVRTRAEQDWVGRIAGAIEIEWLTYPGMKSNPHFPAHLDQQVEREALVLFICRSGGRSHAAATAATQAGYTSCYNVLEGFEGDVDADKHRNTLGGWRAARLPWQQG
jgi:rhodanese-related sulfurtransferase